MGNKLIGNNPKNDLIFGLFGNKCKSYDNKIKEIEYYLTQIKLLSKNIKKIEDIHIEKNHQNLDRILLELKNIYSELNKNIT